MGSGEAGTTVIIGVVSIAVDFRLFSMAGGGVAGVELVAGDTATDVITVDHGKRGVGGGWEVE